jgi:hypothetical protein
MKRVSPVHQSRHHAAPDGAWQTIVHRAAIDMALLTELRAALLAPVPKTKRIIGRSSLL